ncbi:MAG: motility associated factor glycosyltransferase family protein [Treponema sp.]|nr:motility associated factor glycosyltransferase family protein [Treponema sp.]
MTAKNGSVIPVLKNGRTVDSKYNPQKEAESILQGISCKTKYNYFIILGIGSGLFIKELSKKFGQSRIIAVERSEKDLDFLLQIDTVKKLKDNANVFFTSADKLSETVCSTYLPAKYEKPEIIEQRAWKNENQDIIELISSNINKALRIISADYSVQAHFGKIWMHNIMTNLQLSEKKFEFQIDRSKKAAVLAAGPSLEKSISKIIENKNSYFVIATDTALQALIKYKCHPDAVISIDGQAVSREHFQNCPNDSLYFFDLCANPSAAKHIIKKGGKVIYFSSGHPLSSLASDFTDSLPHIFSGAGTVTIAAVDLAVKLGFEKISVLGADFGFWEKAYTRGTYLHTLYSLSENKLQSLEKQYDRLMYRTPLIITDEKKTTELLEAYRKSFLEYLSLNSIKYSYQDNEYSLTSNAPSPQTFHSSSTFNFSAFLNYCKRSKAEELEIPLLPYVAYLKNRAAADSKFEYLYFLKLAHTFIVRYNN